jgi:tRNA threonylcarbamoyladenosine biosynthesis protein TsaB
VRDGATLAVRHWRTERSHLGDLPAHVTALLAAGGLRLDDVQALAVSIGPGSFTGLRVAVAFAKGLAFAGELPVAAVSTLEALAWVAEAAPPARVLAALDARKGEIYAAFFAPERGTLRRLTPDAVWKPAALAAACDTTTVVVGDAPDAHAGSFAAATVRPFALHHPRGDVVARLGMARLAAGAAVPLAALEPAYVRAPDAKLPDNPLR